jgi:hypothetical protein
MFVEQLCVGGDPHELPGITWRGIEYIAHVASTTRTTDRGDLRARPRAPMAPPLKGATR